MAQFHESGYGRTFFEGQLPMLISALKGIEAQLRYGNPPRCKTCNHMIEWPGDSDKWLGRKAPKDQRFGRCTYLLSQIGGDGAALVVAHEFFCGYHSALTDGN